MRNTTNDVTLENSIDNDNRRDRNGQPQIDKSTFTMHRTLPELVDYFTRELNFSQGVFLMTGTCLVPGGDFTLQRDDVVVIQVGTVMIENTTQT